jgi:hypothetical protein
LLPVLDFFGLDDFCVFCPELSGWATLALMMGEPAGRPNAFVISVMTILTACPGVPLSAIFDFCDFLEI